jgi:hypothetical protein
MRRLPAALWSYACEGQIHGPAARLPDSVVRVGDHASESTEPTSRNGGRVSVPGRHRVGEFGRREPAHLYVWQGTSSAHASVPQRDCCRIPPWLFGYDGYPLELLRLVRGKLPDPLDKLQALRTHLGPYATHGPSQSIPILNDHEIDE